MRNWFRVSIMTAVLLSGAAVWMRRAQAQSPALAGSYGFQVSVPYAGGSTLPGAILGVMRFDGAGRVTGSQTVVQPEPDPGVPNPVVQTAPLRGVYTVNGDGTGTMNLVAQDGRATPLAFVITDGGSNLMLMQTAGGNYVLTGTARKQ